MGENIKNLLTSSYDLHGVVDLLNKEPEVGKDRIFSELNIHKGENIAYAKPSSTMNEIRDAAKKAHMMRPCSRKKFPNEFILSMIIIYMFEERL